MFGKEFCFGLWLYILAFELMQLLEQIYLSPFPDSLVLSYGVLLLRCMSENDECYCIFPGMVFTIYEAKAILDSLGLKAYSLSWKILIRDIFSA